jgi:predicted dehydrogenase
MKEQVASLGDINQVIRYGPVDLDSIYGGVFFYGVHIVQPLMYMFGDDIEKVKVSREGKNSNATLVFGSGLFATLIFRKLTRGWETFVETADGLLELKSGKEEGDPPKHYVDMVEMFRTGKEPRSHESILKCVAVLEALERSASSQDWEKVIL